MLPEGWNIAFTIIVGVVGFIGGWLAHTQQIRMEVYKRTLDFYLQINSAASELFLAVARSNTGQIPNLEPIYEARIKLMELMVSNTILLSEKVGTGVRELLSATNVEGDATDAVRRAFNELILEIASEMRLENVHRINAVMLGAVRQKERV